MVNTYPVALYILREQFEGSVYRRKEREGEKPSYEWTVTGRNALTCMRRLLPFLVEKRRQAELVLEMDRYPPHSEQRKTMDKELSEAKRIRYD